MSGAQLKEQIPKTLESVGLLEYQGYRIGKLSKGMIQRLSVAQAMLGQPLPADPRRADDRDRPGRGRRTSGLSSEQFVEDGGAIIMSSHIMSEVESLCTSVAVVHSGRMIFRGAISDFIKTSLDSAPGGARGHVCSAGAHREAREDTGSLEGHQVREGA